MCRLIQYFLVLIMPTLRKEGERYRVLTKKLDNLHDNMVITRKVLRFGRPLTLLKDIIDRSKSSTKVVFWRAVSDLMLITYCLIDHPVYLKRLGVIRFRAKLEEKFEFYKNALRLSSRVIDIFVNIVDLYYIQKDIKILVST